MSATAEAVYEKLHRLRVNGVCFDDSMSWQQALELMSSIDKALPDLYAGSTTGKFKILQKLTEMLQKSLQSCAQGAEKCELCGAESTEDDFYRQRLGSNPLGCGDGAGAQGEEDESEEEEDELCHGLRHVPPNLRRAVLVALWSFLLRTQKDNKALMGQLFAELYDDSDGEEAEDPELRQMVLQALDAFNISIVVGHHEDAQRGKQARQSFRMGGTNQTQVIVKPSLLLAEGANFVQELKGDKAFIPGNSRIHSWQQPAHKVKEFLAVQRTLAHRREAPPIGGHRCRQRVPVASTQYLRHVCIKIVASVPPASPAVQLALHCR